MKIEVWTGQTKAKADTVLLPIILGEETGDRVFLLLHGEGKAAGVENLREECMSVLTHAVLEGDGEGYTRLESALKELNGLLKGFLLSGAVKDVHAVVGLLEKDGMLHLSHVGRAEAYVVREGSTTQVTEYYRGKPPSAFMHIVSGAVETKDHFIISTQRLLRTMTPAQLAQLVHQHGNNVVDAITARLASEKEVACIIHVSILSGAAMKDEATPRQRPATGQRTRTKGRTLTELLTNTVRRVDWSGLTAKLRKKKSRGGKIKDVIEGMQSGIRQFFADLYHPERKRRAHLLLLAGSAAVFIIIWMVVQLSLTSQKSQSRGQLKTLVAQINADISTSSSRQLAGDTESANAILERAEERAKQVMSNESGLFRSEALELLDRIKSKKEEINHIVRVVPPRVMANLSGKKADILAQGFIGSPNGEFTVYDRQNLYVVSLNTVESANQLGSQELILDGDSFSRFQSKIFLMTGNSVMEVVGGQPTTMKTEDPAGWVTGADIKTYLRYLYILAPERKQIYKYEKLSSNFGPPAEYNVNGDLTGALNMTITGPVYVLKDTSTAAGGTPGQRDVLKLLRGLKQTFTIRNLPPGALNNVTKIFKSSSAGNFYFLDPEGKRVIVTTNDGDLGDSLYVKQYILDSEQVGTLKDLYVDPEDTRLYVLDEKKLYAIDLLAK